MRARIVAYLAAFAGLMAPVAFAAPATVHDAWLRALPGGLPASGYFTLHNTGGRTLVLRGATSPACGMLMLHRSNTEGGMARMQDLPQVAVAPGASVRFAPGGYHLMCSDPAAALKPGARIGVTLEFAGGGKLDAVFAVRGAAGR